MGLSNVENILEQALAGEPITIKPESRVEALLIALIETGGGGGGGGTTNYNSLSNKPQINGHELQGNQTAAELGLVASVAGKGLSTNDYDNTEKGKVADNAEAIEAMSDHEPNDITSRLSDLATAISEGNLTKYGYKIGDYFDGTNYRYWLAHLDYNYGGYNSYAVLNTHNIAIVVDTKNSNSWNATDDTTSGYEASALHTILKTTVFDNIKADFNTLFTSWSDHLLSETKLFNYLGTWNWSASPEYITALTEVNVYGCPIQSVDGFQQGEADQQLDIFRTFKYNRIFGATNVWLRSIASSTKACNIFDLGAATSGNASDSLRIAGLIIFH